jgi:hypothetical protein
MSQLQLIRLEAQFQARACAKPVEVKAFCGRRLSGSVVVPVPVSGTGEPGSHTAGQQSRSGHSDNGCSLYEVSSFHVVEVGSVKLTILQK